MPLTRSVLVSTPERKSEDWDDFVWKSKPFQLTLGLQNFRLSYEELAKIISDADGEIRDYLGEEHV